MVRESTRFPSGAGDQTGCEISWDLCGEEEGAGRERRGRKGVQFDLTALPFRHTPDSNMYKGKESVYPHFADGAQ